MSSEWVPRQEQLAVFGKGNAAAVIVEPLYAPVASATRGVHLVRCGGLTAVLKLLAPPQREAADDEGPWGAQWSESAPYFWRREAALFESGVVLPPAPGFRLPACYGVFDRPDGSVAIWLEDLTAGVPGTLISPADYPELGRKLGRAQARWAGVKTPDAVTLSERWLGEYVERHGSDMELLAERGVLAKLPLSAGVDESQCEDIAEIWSERHQYLAFLDAGEQTVCHFDLTPKNLFALGDDVVVIDWAFVGRGALGVDAGPFVTNASGDFLVPSDEAPALSLRFEEAFVQGLRDEGWSGEREMIRGASAATVAIKFAWLLPTILRAAISDWQSFNGRPKEEGMSRWSRLVPFVIAEARVARSVAGF